MVCPCCPFRGFLAVCPGARVSTPDLVRCRLKANLIIWRGMTYIYRPSIFFRLRFKTLTLTQKIWENTSVLVRWKIIASVINLTWNDPGCISDKKFKHLNWTSWSQSARSVKFQILPWVEDVFRYFALVTAMSIYNLPKTNHTFLQICIWTCLNLNNFQNTLEIHYLMI